MRLRETWKTFLKSRINSDQAAYSDRHVNRQIRDTLIWSMKHGIILNNQDGFAIKYSKYFYGL